MNNYLLIRKNTGVVENAIVWDGVSEYALNDAYILLPWNNVICPWIGWTYNSDGSWSSPLDEED